MNYLINTGCNKQILVYMFSIYIWGARCTHVFGCTKFLDAFVPTMTEVYVVFSIILSPHLYCFYGVDIYKTGFDLSFWSAVMKIYPFGTLYWVKHENIYPHKFSKPIRQYIFLSYWKQIYCLKLQFLRPNRHLFDQIQQY